MSGDCSADHSQVDHPFRFESSFNHPDRNVDPRSVRPRRFTEVQVPKLNFSTIMEDFNEKLYSGPGFLFIFVNYSGLFYLF